MRRNHINIWKVATRFFVLSKKNFFCIIFNNAKWNHFLYEEMFKKHNKSLYRNIYPRKILKQDVNIKVNAQYPLLKLLAN